MKQLFILLLTLSLPIIAVSQRVTVKATCQPASDVFRSIMDQTGKNFVYSSEILKDLTVTVDAKNQPLKKVLDDMFSNSGIIYKVKGNNVILKRKPGHADKDISAIEIKKTSVPERTLSVPMLLDEVLVVSRLESPAVETAEIGAKKISSDELHKTPAMFGENDVIKVLQKQPGVSESAEGMAGMTVHGGNLDENLYMLDNVPLYQVNHFAGLFSAFNPDIIRYIDFFKSSVPAKYDGRLSSFMDVRLKSSSQKGHHGSARLGLTSGAFNISGPVDSKTSYLFGLRRSWYDILTIPALAIINSSNTDEKIRFRYYFMDLNACINHRFSSNANGFLSVYFGNDHLKSGSEDKTDAYSGWYEDYKVTSNWGNLVVTAGLNYRLRPHLTAEFTAAYTRYFSDMKLDDYNKVYYGKDIVATREMTKSDNNINDWIFKGDFFWIANDNSKVRFGGNYIRHSFLPSRTIRKYSFDSDISVSRDSVSAYGANEFNAYIEDEWRISDNLRTNAGLHASLFYIDRRLRHGVSPRLSLSWKFSDNASVKAAYTRTTQYIHQLMQSYLALPTDQWIPITGHFNPQTADKVAAGIYVQSADRRFAAYAEGYYKKMNNLIEYRDECYLSPPAERWDARLASGKGTAKGIDFKLEKLSGKFTGHIAYSLAWSNRTFKEKNGGQTYPSRFDNRHTVNILLNWNISRRVSVNAAWTGHSGNRFTLLTQTWEGPYIDTHYTPDNDIPLKAPVNNYQLPFYHRLDLACDVKNSRGFWTFSIYNAYCHLNTIAIRRGHKRDGTPTFQKVKLLPIIPSISYTWQF